MWFFIYFGTQTMTIIIIYCIGGFAFWIRFIFYLCKTRNSTNDRHPNIDNKNTIKLLYKSRARANNSTHRYLFIEINTNTKIEKCEWPNESEHLILD